MVTYRLAGVDGEATEEVVDSLADSDSAADQDPEVKFGIARDIAEVGPGSCLSSAFKDTPSLIPVGFATTGWEYMTSIYFALRSFHRTPSCDDVYLSSWQSVP